MRTLIDQCDRALRAGRGAEAVKHLRALPLTSLERKWRLPLANLCRRAELFSLGLKLLAPLIYPVKFGLIEAATAAERAEYAVLLMKIGSIDEAMQMLDSIGEGKLLEVPLYRSFCHMARWDYAPAAAELERYLAHRPEPYPALVARVNLAASWLSIQNFTAAAQLLDRILVDAEAGGYQRLRANCLELRSQVHLAQGNVPDCERCLSQAAAILTTQATTDQLYIHKWQAVLAARAGRDVSPLLAFKAEALQRQSWENVREADFQILKVNFDPERFEHLLWGTPHVAYHQRVAAELGRSLVADHFVFGPAGGATLDLRTARASSGDLNAGKSIHRVLMVLLRDFYRPINLGTMHVALFPGEKFNIFSSPDRVHQALHRARSWLRKNDIPVRIDGQSGHFKLALTGVYSILLGRPAAISGSVAGPWEPRDDVLYARLQELLGGRTRFSTRVVGEALSLSRTSVVSWLNRAVARGELCKSGNGRATRYHFPILAPRYETASKSAA